jgi:hypothetical protein
VVISGRRVAEGEKLAKEITSGGGSALFVRTDVARAAMASKKAESDLKVSYPVAIEG